MKKLNTLAAVALAASTMMHAPTGREIAVPKFTRPEPPRISMPASAIRTKRQSRKIAERQRRKARRRHEAAARRRMARSPVRPEITELQRVINAMTNHERHLWSRHCGNDRKKRHDIAVARRFQNPLARALHAAGSANIDPGFRPL